MPKYFFDLHKPRDIIIDDEGIALTDVNAARRLAIELLGQAILDGAHENIPTVKVEVRDATNGSVLRVSATIAVDQF